MGQFACFSLQDWKHVTCGDGGVVASNDERFGPALPRFGDKGFDRIDRLDHGILATNYRMSEPQAAVAAAQLMRLEVIAAKRARFGNLLTEKIRNIPGIQPHQVRADGTVASIGTTCSAFHPDAFRCDRAGFIKALIAEGVAASPVLVQGLLYQKAVFRNHGFFAGRWPDRGIRPDHHGL